MKGLLLRKVPMWATVYTDASFTGNKYLKTGFASYAIWAKCDKGVKTHSSSSPKNIKNSFIAEMFGMYAGVFHATKWWDGITGVRVVCDCMSAVEFLNYSNFIKIRNQINFSDIDSIEDPKIRIMARMYSTGVHISTRWVKGHNSKSGKRGYINDKVDKLARKKNKALL